MPVIHIQTSTAIMDEQVREDRAWFAAHTDARVRERPYRRAEFSDLLAVPEHEITGVAVYRIDDNVQVRVAFSRVGGEVKPVASTVDALDPNGPSAQKIIRLIREQLQRRGASPADAEEFFFLDEGL